MVNVLILWWISFINRGLTAMEPLLDVVELGEYVKKKREEEGLSIRQLATITQISSPTLSRIENGVCNPDSPTLARLSSWLAIPLDSLMKGSLIPESGEGFLEIVKESTPNVIEAHLRADPKLKPDAAKALAELFRVAYTQFTSDDLEEIKSSPKKVESKKTRYAKGPRK